MVCKPSEMTRYFASATDYTNQMIYDSFSDVGESRVWFASASDPFFGVFWVISEVGSQIYIANLAIFKI